MNSLDPMKSVTLYLEVPALPDTLVRTGVHGDGSCFFHSYLLATENHYRSLSYEERLQKVKTLRQQLADSITLDKWYALEDIATVESERVLTEHISQLYTDPSSLSCVNQNVWDIMKQLFKKDEIEKTLLPLSNDKSKISKLVSDKLSPLTCSMETAEDIQYMTNLEKLSNELLITLVDSATQNAMENFKKSLAEPSTEVNDAMLTAFRFFCKYDLIFVNGRTRQRYETGHAISGKKPIVIILWVNECHYESVGRLLSGNKIQRIFEPSDHLIEILEDKE